ncbi:MAG: M20/M25/M40 family metallo-hydrolase, partial [Actinomycetota bacterium]|nr:M20/M25/M40 family metallo-hydrolase [Actinomycetota bacterium]
MDRLSALTDRAPRMLDDLAALVGVESPSDDLAACRAVVAATAELGTDLLGQRPEVLEVGALHQAGEAAGAVRTHLRWRFGEGRVLLVGHLDTVWPLGTLAVRPFSVEAGVVTGPGCFDMKAGVVQALHALTTLDDLEGIEVLLTTDEELGSQTSRALVEEGARRARAALVCEPAADGGALKVGRKGTGMYTFVVSGRSAHAGLEPEKGANALVEAAYLVLALGSVGWPEVGTTVTPTVAAAGTATNVVPSEARVEVDVRVAQPGEAERVDAALRALAPTVPGCRLEVHGGPNRPPMPASGGAALWAKACSAATSLGLPQLT